MSWRLPERFIIGATLLTCLLTICCAAVALGQPVILDKFPPNGSVQAGACGPFGVRLEPGVLSNYNDALIARGSATGIRVDGLVTASVNGDSLYYIPAVPFALGEQVTITLKGSLTSDGIALGNGISWQVQVQPTEDNQTDNLASMVENTVSLSSYFAPGDFEFLAGKMSDLNADALQEVVLLLSSQGVDYLVTIAQDRRPNSDTIDWAVRAPVACTVDNPVDLCLLDVDFGYRRDLALLTLSGLQVWLNPGQESSPAGGLAQWYDFPAGFNARTIKSGDIDSDGDQDLVIFGLFGQQYLVYRNDGASGLTSLGIRAANSGLLPTVTSADKALPWPIKALLADVDNDGNLDLIWGADFQESGQYPVRLARGLGSGEFGSAGILTTNPDYAPGLLFGRILDPWDTPDNEPIVLVAGPDNNNSTDNICGVAFSGFWPGDNIGCILAPGISALTGSIVLGNFMSDGQGQVQYPEVVYADPETGMLTVQSTEAGRFAETRETGINTQAVFYGDINYDGDGDLVLVREATADLLLLRTVGGNPANYPRPAGVANGGEIDFGVREISCPEAEIFGHIPFTNEGLRPAIIDAVRLNDSTGVFSLGTIPAAYFGTGCFGDEATVMIPINFAPADTINYTANLSIDVRWVGASAGQDSVLVSEFVLTGRGGVYQLRDNGTGLGGLFWQSTGGYSTSGGSVDFGELPALSSITETTEVSLTNVGDFPIEILPPTITSELWSISPDVNQQIGVGQTQVWTIEITPHQDMIPAGEEGFFAGTALTWQARPLGGEHCLSTQAIQQTVQAKLLAVEPCLAIDTNCDGTELNCAETDSVTVLEGLPFSYCLRVMDWVWPGADPQLRIIENSFDWLNISLDTSNSGSDPRITFDTTLVGSTGGYVSVEVRDARFQTLQQTFRLRIAVEPALPDLLVSDMWFVPIDESELSQQDPFYVNVVVEAHRRDVIAASVTLNGESCFCDLGEIGSIDVDLAEGQRDTVSFLVEYCSESGDCGFTACIEPRGGLVADYNPDNNCHSFGTVVRANGAPTIEFFNLSLDPPDPALVSCDGSQPWNEIIGNLVARLGVREGNELNFSIRGVDVDGDDRVLSIVDAPDFVSYTAVNDTLINITVSPGAGLVTTAVCQDFGPLSLVVRETTTVEPESTNQDIPLFVKWEGPDLGVSLTGLPGSAELQDIVRFTGRVTCQENNAGPFIVDMWLTDPTSMRVAARRVEIESLPAGQSILIPQLLDTVELPGEYCAHIAITGIRDVNPENNTLSACFKVAPGPFEVSPNVATPNGDGHNDNIWFHFSNQVVAHPRVRIFELNGHKVYESDDLDSEHRLSWDGRNHDGRLMPPGTYIYILYDNTKEFSKGTCGVIR